MTCGSVVKLQHASTGVNLHSHEISYGSGSGQQSVTGYTGGDDANDYWAVRGTEVCNLATSVPVSSSCILPDNSLRNSGSHHAEKPRGVLLFRPTAVIKAHL